MVMKTADISDDTILDIVRRFNERGSWCLTYDLEERLPQILPKLILSKCRNLLKRGKMHGCPCGCRGDFYLDGYLW